MSILEDAILNTQGDFAAAASTIKDICTEERSLGIWLASMVTHQDLVDKLSENPPLAVPLQYPPLLFKTLKTSVKHDEFIAFLRAVIGICCVLAVYAWADSLPDRYCRERALGILRLWQGVDGYREVRTPFPSTVKLLRSIGWTVIDPQPHSPAATNDLSLRMYARQ